MGTKRDISWRTLDSLHSPSILNPLLCPTPFPCHGVEHLHHKKPLWLAAPSLLSPSTQQPKSDYLGFNFHSSTATHKTLCPVKACVIDRSSRPLPDTPSEHAAEKGSNTRWTVAQTHCCATHVSPDLHLKLRGRLLKGEAVFRGVERAAVALAFSERQPVPMRVSLRVVQCTVSCNVQYYSFNHSVDL
ncbi:hypothetical protein JZ751_024756 [Albula glossodonta]|uniref:Uncharacterized protein n=1 Tax=Albula glossodonta TaxID=121402 RepID=A0A8T2PMG7_9TELE|nr:hypothetical protein JZ751_024756 [Albula glossodonta]